MTSLYQSPEAEPVFGLGGGAAETVYRPNSTKQWRAIAIAAGFVAISGALTQHDIVKWMNGVAPLDGQTLILVMCGLFFLLLGGVALVGVMRGLPRLTITAADVTLEGLLGTLWAPWHSLSSFTLTSTSIGSGRRQMSMATAALIGSEASRAVLRRRKFTIPDSFQTPIGTLIAEINARQAKAVGQAPPPPGVAAAENSFGVADFQAPWLTFALLALLVIVFAGEQIYAVAPGGPLLRPNIQTLVALGALSRTLVMQGEWYRLFTAPLLHGDFTHILLNGVALLMVGYPLERLVGRVWLLAFYVIGGLGGALMSMAVNADTLISVGASGAIMGLFAAVLVCSFRLSTLTNQRSRIQSQALRVLIPSLIPLATHATAGQIDYGAHIGGALSCAVVAYALLKAWPDDARLPPFGGLAAGIAVLGALLTGASVAASAAGYGKYATSVSLAPPDALARMNGAGAQSAAELAARYPQDPRAHFYLARAMIQSKDFAGAERELREATKQADDLRFLLGTQLADSMRATLAAVLLEEGRTQEAKETARAVCQASADGPVTAKLHKALVENHLCD